MLSHCLLGLVVQLEELEERDGSGLPEGLCLHLCDKSHAVAEPAMHRFVSFASRSPNARIERRGRLSGQSGVSTADTLGSRRLSIADIAEVQSPRSEAGFTSLEVLNPRVSTHVAVWRRVAKLRKLRSMQAEGDATPCSNLSQCEMMSLVAYTSGAGGRSDTAAVGLAIGGSLGGLGKLRVEVGATCSRVWRSWKLISLA